MLVRTEQGTKDVSLVSPTTGAYNVTAENYIVPDGEEHLYHVIQEVKKFNAETGKRLSRPVVQKYGKKEYESIVQRQLKLQGYTVEVLHKPVQVAQNAKTATATDNSKAVSKLESELAALKAELAAMKAKKPAAKKPAPKKVDVKAAENKDEK